MLLLALSLTFAQAPMFAPRFQRFGSRGEPGRSDRGFDDTGLAFFEAFPASGAGTTTACSTTAPTGAKGEALTFTRASTATCTKTATGGLTATGIAVGDLVSLGNNVARVEYDSNGVLGLLVESSGANSLLRSEEIENVAWTSTATVTANAATPPQTTGQISNAEQLSDASAVAFQGSCQTISTTSATQHTFYAYVRAGTATGAQVTMTGVGSSTGDCTATKSGLSGTTWDILGCSSPAAYGALLTSVMVCINVGTVVADTGTVMAWGADYKVSAAYRTSYTPTAGAGGARAAETATLPGATWPVSPVSFAMNFTAPWSGTTTAADMFYGNVASNSGWTMGWTGAALRSQPCAAGACATLDVAQGPTALITARWAVSYSGTQTTMLKDAVVIAGPTAKTAPASPWATAVNIGQAGFGTSNAILSRLCVDSDPTRCR